MDDFNRYIKKYINVSYEDAVRCIDFDRINLGISHDNYKSAIAKIKTFTDDEAKHYVIGLIYEFLSRYDDALKHFEIVVKTRGTGELSFGRHLINCYQQSNDCENIFRGLLLCAEHQKWINDYEVFPMCSEECIQTVYDKFTELEYDNQKLKKRIAVLEEHIKYAPEGAGYLEAKKEFEELAKK